MNKRSRIVTACAITAASIGAGFVTYSMSMASAATSAPEIVESASPTGRPTDCIGNGPDIEHYRSRGELLPNLTSFESGSMVRGDQNPCGGGDGGGGDSPCSTDPFAGAQGLGGTWITGFISGTTNGEIRPTSDQGDLSSVVGGLGGGDFVGFSAQLGCLSLTASLGAYTSDSAANVIFSINGTNTSPSSAFIHGKPFMTVSGNSIVDAPGTFPDLVISGPTDVTADFNAVVYTLKWFTQGGMAGSPNVYTFSSD